MYLITVIILLHSKEILVSGAGLQRKPSCTVHEMLMRALYPGIDIVVCCLAYIGLQGGKASASARDVEGAVATGGGTTTGFVDL